MCHLQTFILSLYLNLRKILNFVKDNWIINILYIFERITLHQECDGKRLQLVACYDTIDINQPLQADLFLLDAVIWNNSAWLVWKTHTCAKNCQFLIKKWSTKFGHGSYELYIASVNRRDMCLVSFWSFCGHISRKRKVLIKLLRLLYTFIIFLKRCSQFDWQKKDSVFI